MVRWIQNIVNILLAILVTTGMAGWSIYSHHCQSANKTYISVFDQKTDCGHSTEQECCNKEKSAYCVLSNSAETCQHEEQNLNDPTGVFHSNCCVNDLHVFQVDITTSNEHQTLVPTVLAIDAFSFSQSLPAGIPAIALVSSIYNSPPVLPHGQSMQVQNCTYLI
jgi:hypothetical protein